jgi:hypothetical protein
MVNHTQQQQLEGGLTRLLQLLDYEIAADKEIFFVLAASLLSRCRCGIVQILRPP